MIEEITRDSEAGRFLVAAVKRSREKFDGHTGKTGNPGNIVRGREIYATLSGGWHQTTDPHRLEALLTRLHEAGFVDLAQHTAEGGNFRVTPAGIELVESW